MATRAGEKRIDGGVASVDQIDPAVERSSQTPGIARPTFESVMAFTPFAVLLAGWVFLWLVTLRLLFLQGRFLEFTASIGFMLLPFVGLLGWMAWKARRTNASQH